jgi:nitroimidazol reductase NimA-like FMN-containing flavoprotein (pyridoxamine 5'-phosphate oxidase superfamily)
METARIKIAEYLAAHFYLRLGSVTTSSTSQVHTVGYVSDGCTVSFVTDRNSRKAKNISANPAVAFAVDENYTDPMAIRGVQMEGWAALVARETEVIKLLDMVTEKFPGIAEMPANPDLVIFRIEPSTGYYLDNTVTFGHREKVTF